MQRRGIFAGAVLLLASVVAMAADAPPVARVENVTDTYFGTDVVDPYRWMEDDDSPELAKYLRAQQDYTAAQFAKLKAPRDKLLARIRELQEGAATVRFIRRANGRYFFFETPKGDKDARLMMRAVEGGPSTLVVDPKPFHTQAAHAAIGYYTVANDGSHVAFGVCLGGGEDCTLRFVEVKSGKLLEDALTDPIGWSMAFAPDGRTLYYVRLKALAKDAPPTTKYDDVRIYRHVLGTPQSQDIAVFGHGIDGSPDIPVAGFPNLDIAEDGSVMVASHNLGTVDTPQYFARVDDTKQWRRIASREDEVRSFALRGHRAIVVTTKGGENGRVVTFDARTETMADAKEIVPASDVILATDGWVATPRDAMYIGGHRDGISVLRRLPYDGGAIATITLPVEGTIQEATSEPDADGLSFDIDGPARAPAIYRYDPKAKRVVDTGLRPRDPADYSRIRTWHGNAPSTGGVEVPVVVIGRDDVKRDGTAPLLMIAYGSYGIRIPMMFTPANLAWYERGGLIAYAHVRGGGEKGEAWHRDGQTTKKQHTIDDFIAAAQWLIDEGYTSRAKLAVAGKSAGGVPSGGIVVQRPDLIRAALIRVGVTDMIGIERSSGGPANTFEYGSVAKEDEFRALLAYSPYANVKAGTTYPAVMLETGINDPRVPPWQLAKMAARLQAANASTNPILLRVDYDAGHGVGLDKTQVAALMADEFTFLGWQLGMDGFAPE